SSGECRMNLGSYQIGRYYSTSFSGMPGEFELLHAHKGVGRTPNMLLKDDSGGWQKTMRIAALLHETTHYLHDLSLGACVAADELRDQSALLLWSSLRGDYGNERIVCPRPEQRAALLRFPELAQALDLARRLYHAGTSLIDNENPGDDRRPKQIYNFGGIS